MRWEAWPLLVLVIMGVLYAPMLVGKERKPFTSRDVVTTIVLAGVQLWLIIRLGAS